MNKKKDIKSAFIGNTKNWLFMRYNNGGAPQAPKKDKQFRKFLKSESKKRQKSPEELIDYFLAHKDEFHRLYRKIDFKDSISIKEKIEESLIKVSIHSQEQKFGKPPKSAQLSIFDQLQDKNIVKQAMALDIDVVGWDLTRAEDQAVFAIQKIYSNYNYTGNIGNGNTLVFTPAEFYKNYGVKKFISSNGKEMYSGAGKEQALQALFGLSKKQCIIAFNELDLKTTKKKGEQIFNRIETISSIIPEMSFLYIGLDGKEIEEFEIGKRSTKRLKGIKIVPSKVLLSQIGNYYALLPTNLYTEIKDRLPKVKNKHLPNFIHWLAKEVAIKRRRQMGSTVEISLNKLSYILRMDNWIKANRKSLIENRLKDCFKWSNTLGYLKGYKFRKGKKGQKIVNLYMNPEKFKPSKQIREFIESQEEEGGEPPKYGAVKNPKMVKASREKINNILGFFNKNT